MKWYNDFALTGYLERKPIKITYGKTGRKYIFQIVQRTSKHKIKIFNLQTYNTEIVNGLERIRRKALMKVDGELQPLNGRTYLIVHKMAIIRIGKEDLLEAKNGNKNDSNEHVAGQGVSQVKEH